MSQDYNFKRRNGTALGALAVALLCSLGTALGTQDGGRPAPPPLPEAPGSGGSAVDQLQQELTRLFGEVESHLQDVDTALFDASGADPFGDGAGLSQLIDDATLNGRAAVDKIDELLDLAKRMQEEQQKQQQQQQQQGQGQNQRQSGQQQQQGQGQNQRQSGQQQQQQQSSSQGQEQQHGQSGRENTPEAPSEAGADAQGQGREQQASTGDQPQDGGENPEASGNSAAERAQREAAASAANATGFGAWGELPPRAQEVFTNRASDDMPTQYRDWIDSYYRRVSKAP